MTTAARLDRGPRSGTALRLAACGLLACGIAAGSALSCKSGLLSDAEQKKLYTVTIKAGAGGLVLYSGTSASSLKAQAENDQDLSVTAVPSLGYAFAGWTIASGKGKLKSASAFSTTFTVQGSDASIAAGFAANGTGGAGVGVGTGAIQNLTVTVNGSSRIARTAAGASALNTNNPSALTPITASYAYTAMIGAASVNSAVTSVTWYLDGVAALSANAASVGAPSFSGVSASGSGAANCGLAIDGTLLPYAGSYQLTCEIVYQGNRYSGSAKVLVSDQQTGLAKWVAPWNGASSVSDVAVSPSGTVYVGSSIITGLQSFSASSGASSLISYGDRIPGTPAVCRDGRIAFISSGGYAVLIASSGTAQANSVSYSLIGSPALGADDYIYARDGSNDLLVYGDGGGGSPLAQVAVAPMGGGFSSGPSIGADGTIVLGCSDGNIYASYPGGGGNKWPAPFNTGGPVHSTPAIDSSGNVYVGSDAAPGTLFKIDSSGNLLHSRPISYWGSGFTLDSGPVISSDGKIIYITGGTGTDAYILAIDASTLALASPTAYNTFAGYNRYGSPAVASDGTAYFCMDKGASGYLFAYRFNGTDFQSQWTYTLPSGRRTAGSSPAIGPDGTVYFTASDGTNGYVYAIYGGAPPATTGWPMLGKNARRSGCGADAQ